MGVPPFKETPIYQLQIEGTFLIGDGFSDVEKSNFLIAQKGDLEKPWPKKGCERLLLCAIPCASSSRFVEITRMVPAVMIRGGYAMVWVVWKMVTQIRRNTKLGFDVPGD